MFFEIPKFKMFLSLELPPCASGELCHGFYSPGHGHGGWCCPGFNFPQVFGVYQAPRLIVCWEKTGFKELGGITAAKKWVRSKERVSVKLQGPLLGMRSPLWIQHGAFGCCYENDTYTKHPDFRDMLLRGAEFLQSPPHWAAATSSQFPWKAGSPKRLFPVGP